MIIEPTPESGAEPETLSPLLPAFQELIFTMEVDGWYGETKADFKRIACGGIYTQKEVKHQTLECGDAYIFECEDASPEHLALPGLRGNCMTITRGGASIKFTNEKGYFTCGELVNHIANYEEIFRPHVGPSDFESAFEYTTFDRLIPQDGENTFTS